ncbi:MAG TPA: DUF6717 family protein [Gemmataceae bacterium]
MGPHLFTIEPYRLEHGWVFDDPSVGLYREPFVGAVNALLDRLAASLPGSPGRFRLVFSDAPFEGGQASASWVRSDPAEGDWYQDDETGLQGWLCPALTCYFPRPPEKIYFRAEPASEAEESG